MKEQHITRPKNDEPCPFFPSYLKSLIVVCNSGFFNELKPDSYTYVVHTMWAVNDGDSGFPTAPLLSTCYLLVPTCTYVPTLLKRDDQEHLSYPDLMMSCVQRFFFG